MLFFFKFGNFAHVMMVNHKICHEWCSAGKDLSREWGHSFGVKGCVNVVGVCKKLENRRCKFHFLGSFRIWVFLLIKLTFFYQRFAFNLFLSSSSTKGLRVWVTFIYPSHLVCLAFSVVTQDIKKAWISYPAHWFLKINIIVYEIKII